MLLAKQYGFAFLSFIFYLLRFVMGMRFPLGSSRSYINFNLVFMSFLSFSSQIPANFQIKQKHLQCNKKNHSTNQRILKTENIQNSTFNRDKLEKLLKLHEKPENRSNTKLKQNNTIWYIINTNAFCRLLECLWISSVSVAMKAWKAQDTKWKL